MSQICKKKMKRGVVNSIGTHTFKQWNGLRQQVLVKNEWNEITAENFRRTHFQLKYLYKETKRGGAVWISKLGGGSLKESHLETNLQKIEYQEHDSWVLRFQSSLIVVSDMFMIFVCKHVLLAESTKIEQAESP